MDQKALAVEDAVYCIRYVTAHLTHPQTFALDAIPAINTFRVDRSMKKRTR